MFFKFQSLAVHLLLDKKQFSHLNPTMYPIHPTPPQHHEEVQPPLWSTRTGIDDDGGKNVPDRESS